MCVCWTLHSQRHFIEEETHLLMSTVVRVNLAPFNNRIMKSLWQKGQFPTLSASTLAWQTDRTHCSWLAVTLERMFLKRVTVNWFWIRVLRSSCRASSDRLNQPLRNSNGGLRLFTPRLNQHLNLVWCHIICFLPPPDITESQAWVGTKASHKG